MKKSLVAMTLVVFVLTTSAVNAKAVEPRAVSVIPVLSFDGTAAQCKVTITRAGEQIAATLELWQGDTFVDSWTRIGTSSLVINEFCEVEHGKTYTLKVSGLAGSERFTGTSVTGTCK